MTPDELLTTTRSVRRRLDLTRPVPADLLRECIEVAVQAPTGGNLQGWQWLIVTDPDLKQFIGERYRVAWYEYSAARAAQSAAAGNPALDASDTRVGQLPRLARSAQFLADHMGEVPAMVIPCIEGRPTGRADADAALYGSIVPATWSFMLAARARGLGTAYTTLHLRDEAEVADRLGIPYARYMQAALLPVGYYTGDQFQAATRIPADSVVRWNHW